VWRRRHFCTLLCQWLCLRRNIRWEIYLWKLWIKPLTYSFTKINFVHLYVRHPWKLLVTDKAPSQFCPGFFKCVPKWNDEERGQFSCTSAWALVFCSFIYGIFPSSPFLTFRPVTNIHFIKMSLVILVLCICRFRLSIFLKVQQHMCGQESTNSGLQSAMATKLCMVTVYICGGLSMDCVSFDRPSAYKFEVTPRILENVCTPGYGYYYSTGL